MLLIDNGNTRTKFAIYDNGQCLFEDKVVNTELSDALSADWLMRLKNALGNDNSVVGCTVGERRSVTIIENKLAEMALSVTWLATQQQNESLVNGYREDWAKLGADRWFALLGYRQLSHNNALIIDAGTALTIDWLRSDGHHLGGWIVPGRRLMQQSLNEGTANLAGLLSESCFREPATNTLQGMSYGVHYALVGALSQALTASTEVFGGSPFSVIVTGGDGERLLKSLQTVETVQYQRIDDLVFKGLAFAADN